MTESESLWDLLVGYVGVGMSCEFGLVQRYCGAEPLDLFRFGYMPLDGMIRQIDAGFGAFADTAMLRVEPDRFGHEFTVREPTSGIRLHTEKYVGQSAIADVARQEFRRIPRLARKMVQELAAAERIVVFCQADIAANDIAALHKALRRHGPVRLLVVTAAAVPDDAGCVIKLSDGAMMGFLDTVQPLTFARYPSVDVWLATLRTAGRLFSDTAAAEGTVGRPRASDFDVPVDVEAHLLWRALGARRRGDRPSAVELFAEYRRQCPGPTAFGCEFDGEFQVAMQPVRCDTR